MREYKVLEACSVQSLESSVRAYLQLGWVLQGGVSLAMQGSNQISGVYVQAMTRQEDNSCDL